MDRYDQTNLPDGDWGEYRKVSITRAIQMSEDFEAVTIHGDVARGKTGDFLVVDSQGHPYPCARVEFAAIYVPVTTS